MQFFCQVCSKRMEMPIVLAALCIPCILNIDLCCLCINSKPEIKPYLKIHLAPGGCLCPLVCLLGRCWQSTSWLIAAPAHSLEEKNWKVQTHYSEYYGNLSCFCCRICSWQKKKTQNIMLDESMQWQDSPAPGSDCSEAVPRGWFCFSLGSGYSSVRITAI